VSNEYTECKVPGIVSRSIILGKYALYSKIKDIVNSIDPEFFDLLNCDYLPGLFGYYSIDIIALDDKLHKLDPEYDNINCTYHGNNVSMAEYVKLKYGKIYVEIIDRLTK